MHHESIPVRIWDHLFISGIRLPSHRKTFFTRKYHFGVNSPGRMGSNPVRMTHHSCAYFPPGLDEICQGAEKSVYQSPLLRDSYRLRARGYP